MDVLNMGMASERKLSAHHAVLFLIALMLCSWLRISLLLIYPFFVIFLYYYFNWKLIRKALYLLGGTLVLWVFSFRNGIYLRYNVVSLYYYLPFVLLLFASPSKKNSGRNYLKILMYALTFIAIINNVFGVFQYIRYPNDDSFEGFYGTFTVSQNGLSLINSVLFFYHLCMFQKHKNNIFLALAIFFISSAVMGFYGAGLIAFLAAIVLTYFRIRLKNILVLLISLAFILVLVYVLMKTISPLTLDYNVNIIKRFLDPTAANAPRKIIIFKNYFDGYTQNVTDLLFGSGPGTFNSRSAFMVGSPTYFNADFLKSAEQPFYFRNYAYTLWNPSNTGPYDGFMNQPFTSLLALLGEYGLLVTACIAFMLLRHFRHYVKTGKQSAQEYGLSVEYKMFRFCSILMMILLIIDNYMEYPEIVALLLFIVKLTEQKMKSVQEV
jgi:hypothetical protein